MKVTFPNGTSKRISAADAVAALQELIDGGEHGSFDLTTPEAQTLTTLRHTIDTKRISDEALLSLQQRHLIRVIQLDQQHRPTIQVTELGEIVLDAKDRAMPVNPYPETLPL